MKRWILKAIALCSTFYAFVRLAHWPIGFTYFTQLSNLFASAALILQRTAGGSAQRQRRFMAVKYAAAVSITMTFALYLTVLAPAMPGGFIAAYRQDHWASLCLHIVTPAAFTADFFFNDAPRRDWSVRLVPCALIPPLAWLGMVRLLARCGFRWHGMTAPYPFLNDASPVGWFGFAPGVDASGFPQVGVCYWMALLLLLFILDALALLRLAERRRAASAGPLDQEDL